MALKYEQICELYDHSYVPVDKILVANVPSTPFSFTDVRFDAHSVWHRDACYVGNIRLKRRASFAPKGSLSSTPSILQTSSENEIASADGKGTAVGSTLSTPDSVGDDAQVDFNSPEVKLAIDRLNDCLAGENLKTLSTHLKRKDLSEKKYCKFNRSSFDTKNGRTSFYKQNKCRWKMPMRL
ncbi:hypothetical protein MAR_034247 [Mya arenaria]|uniref:Uncharacterized protein n=1 Tax=Mya arenaria TaxID=6604 RepID=A0ABY7GBB2_MYAAR|nr:hypothetical protein MAR_034247 [Mya arenaria]